MLIVSINGADYKVPQKWEEIPLHRAVAVNALLPEMPEAMRAIYQAAKNSDGAGIIKLYSELSDHDVIRAFPEFYGKVIAALTDIPQEIIDNTDTYQRTALYIDNLEFVVLGMAFTPGDFEPKGITEFEHKRITYKLPKEGLKLGGKLPGAFMNAKEFTHSADLAEVFRELEKGDAAKMANFVSILCRPEGVPYDEQDSLKRAKEFEDLPMSVVWEVYFFTLDYFQKYASITLRCLSDPKAIKRLLQQRQRSVSSDGTGTS